MNVDLVVLHATVRDRKGRFVSDLRQEHFEVYEDGVRQSIRLFRREDIPVTVGLAVDHSGSMRRKLTDVIVGAKTFVEFSNPLDEMFVVNFNENVTLGLPDAIQFTDSSAELERAIGSAFATGKTALYDAIAKAFELLQAGHREKKVLIVISDGDDTASKHSREQAIQMAEKSSAIIYAVGLLDPGDPDANPEVLNRLARATGGEAFFPSQLKEVAAICRQIARDIRNQYTIGYVPTSAADPGAYRSTRVVVRAPGRGKLSVRARDGYAAPEPEPAECAK